MIRIHYQYGKKVGLVASKKTKNDGPIIIKKYANRRLYNTDSSSYITLDFLAEMTRKDIDFNVIDAKSGDDITHNILTQIIMEEEANGETLLPVGFLKQIISMYGNSMQSMVPQFLDASMTNFRNNHKQIQEVLENVVTSGPFGNIAKQNIEFAKAAREALMPSVKPDVKKTPKDDEPKDDEIAALKKQMAELQAKLDNLDN